MKTLTLNHCIVTIPDKPAAPAVVLYGGLYHMEGNWFLEHKKVSDALLAKAYFVLPTSFNNKYADCIAEFRANVDPKNISAFSLCGFSRGAQEVYRYKDAEQWKLFGLVDPSAPTLDVFQENVLDAYKAKIRCVYWVPNWGRGGYGGRVPRFAQHLRDLRVDMTEKDVRHENMPSFFFETYGTEFTT